MVSVVAATTNANATAVVAFLLLTVVRKVVLLLLFGKSDTSIQRTFAAGTPRVTRVASNGLAHAILLPESKRSLEIRNCLIVLPNLNVNRCYIVQFLCIGHA